MSNLIKLAKRIVKPIVPRIFHQLYALRKTNQTKIKYQNMTTKEIFTCIYEQRGWEGRQNDSDVRYYSGSGSHDIDTISPYIHSVRKFLSKFTVPPDCVDLGCGDFNVGSKVRDLCGKFIACDIVDAVIEQNKCRYKSFNVDFRVLDFLENALPAGDCVFAREVLQHLSNKNINSFIEKASKSYMYMIFTEHLPDKGSFVPNIDQPVGPGIRLFFGSGVVLTKPPFNLKVLDEQVICEVKRQIGVIRTIVYQLNK